MKSFYIFSILVLSSVFYQSIKSDSTALLRSITPILDLNDNSATSIRNRTEPILTSTPLFINMTTTITVTAKSSETTSTTSQFTISSNTTSINKPSTSDADNNRISKSSSRSKWWLVTALIVTLVVVISIGIIYHHRRQTPYKRFLRNWRPRDNDADNIILQLEQPEIINDQWPPRISFA